MRSRRTDPGEDLPVKVRIEKAMLDDPRIRHKPAAMLLLGHLASHLNAQTGSAKVWPGRETLAGLMGYRGETRGRGALNRLVATLQDLGYIASIETERRGNLVVREVYVLRAPPIAERYPQAELALDSAPPEAVASDSRRVASDSPASRKRLTGESPIEKNYRNELSKGGGEARARTQLVDIDRLEAGLLDAAGKALDPVAAGLGLKVLSEPLSWLREGADLDLDVLPAIRHLAARAEHPVRSWKYFRRAVVAARDDRLRSHPPPAPGEVRTATGGSRERQDGRTDDRGRRETRAERERRQIRIAREIADRWQNARRT